MIVVNPDQIAILNVLDDSLGKQTVNFAVSGPSALVESDFTRVVVEKRPENRVCEEVCLLAEVGDIEAREIHPY